MIKTTHPSAMYTLQLHKKRHKPHKNSFETTIIEAVDLALAPLGQSRKKSIYRHLESNFKIKKQDIPCNIEEFANALEQIFGAGARLIEISIIKALHERTAGFVHFPKNGNLVVTEYVDSLRAFLRLQMS